MNQKVTFKVTLKNVEFNTKIDELQVEFDLTERDAVEFVRCCQNAPKSHVEDEEATE